jgi:hypothetical protein
VLPHRLSIGGSNRGFLAVEETTGFEKRTRADHTANPIAFVFQ